MGFPFGLVLFVASTAYSVLSRPKRARDTRDDGFGQQGEFNTSDGGRPIGIGYGIPEFEPAVLYDYLAPDSFDSQNPAGDVRRYVGLSLGGTKEAGIDGRDLSVSMNDAPLFESVTDESPATARTLTEKPGSDGRVFLFPRASIVPDTVAVYVDGTVVHAGANSGETVDATLVREFTDTRVNPIVVEEDGDFEDKEMKDGDPDRVGGLLPFNGEPDGAIEIGAYFDRWVVPEMPGVANIITRSIDPVPDGQVHLGTLKDGRRYFWVAFAKNASRVSYWKTVVSHFLFTGKIRPQVTIKVNDDGTAEARFTESQSGNLVTWTGKTSTAQEQDIVFHFRDGRPDQAPLPFQNGARNTFPVGTELSQGTVATYTTKNEVHDFLVGVFSGTAGFFDVSKTSGNFGQISRALVIRIRESGAADGFADDSKDPSKGWVTIWDKRIYGKVRNGAAPWFFSAANLLAVSRGTLGQLGSQNLPFAKYEVQVVSTDAANVADSVSDLFFANVTEVQRVLTNIPHHASLTVEIKNSRELNANPFFRVKAGMRKVWIPAANATYDATTKRPQPGAWTFTRNPVWCAVDLITDPLFGVGEFFTWEHIDLTSARDAADFCDEAVRKHADTTETETRAELDTFLNDRRSLLDHVKQILRGGPVVPVLVGGTWKFVPDRDDAVATIPGATSGVVEADHLVSDSVRTFYPSLEEEPTEVEVVFTDEEARQEPVPIQVPSEDEPAQRVFHSIDLRGVRRWTQAERIGNLYKRQVALQKWTLEARVKGWTLLQLEAGDVVSVTSPTAGFTAKPMRVQSLSWDSGLEPLLRLTEHVSAVYASGGLAPNSAVRPGLRPPTGATGVTVGSSVPVAPQTAPPRGRVRKATVTRIAAQTASGDA